MKTPTANAIERELRALKTSAPMRPADVFWPDFRARVAPGERSSAEASPKFFVLPFYLKMAASILITAALLVWFVPRSAPAPVAGMNRIDRLEVLTPYSAMFILSDPDRDGTIIWISDLEVTNSNPNHAL